MRSLSSSRLTFMSNLEVESAAESNVDMGDRSDMGQAHSRRKIWRATLAFGVIAVMLLFGLVSRYQPLRLAPSWSTSGPLSPSDVATVSLVTTLANAGSFGVSVQKLEPKVYAEPPVVVAPLRPCFHYVGTTRQCSYDAKGYSVGEFFHPFALNGGAQIPVVWRYEPAWVSWRLPSLVLSGRLGLI